MASLIRAMAVTLVLLASCIVPNDLLEGLPCPCQEGYVCNSDDVCVAGTEPLPEAIDKTCWRETAGCDWTPGTFDFSEDSDFVDEGENHNFSPNACTLYSSQRNPDTRSFDLFSSTRSPAESFPTSALIRHLSTSGDERRAAERADSKELYFLRRAVGGITKIYRSTRDNEDKPWQAGISVDGLNIANVNNGDLSLSPSGLELYFTRSPSVDVKEIFVSTRTSVESAFTSATRVDEIGGAFEVGKPSLTADGKVLTYVKRIGGTNEVNFALRQNSDAAWMPQGPLPGGFFSSANISEVAISADGCEMIALVDDQATRLTHQVR